MKTENAVLALAALAQPTRLDAFRLLIEAGPDGLAAGVIARRLDVVASTLSHHLGLLENANLIRSVRHGRKVIYTRDVDGIRTLLSFLTNECCGGHPELCGELDMNMASLVTDAA